MKTKFDGSYQIILLIVLGIDSELFSKDACDDYDLIDTQCVGLGEIINVIIIIVKNGEL